MKKNKISKNWINQQKRDIYVRRSKIEGYRARSVYKLIEIDDKFKVFKNNQKIIDIGSAPGSWSQYVIKTFKNVKLISVDLKEMKKIGNSYQIMGDFTDPKIKKKITDYFKNKADVLMSDMAVNTTGIKDLDSIQTSELCIEAIKFSKEILNENGQLITKIFMGSSFNEVIDQAKKIYKKVSIFKPKSSRKDSKESFLICKKLR